MSEHKDELGRVDELVTHQLSLSFRKISTKQLAKSPLCFCEGMLRIAVILRNYAFYFAFVLFGAGFEY